MKKLWKLFLGIALVLFVIYFPAIISTIGTWLTNSGFLSVGSTVAGLANIPWWGAAAIGVGLAYLVDPETTSEIIADVGELAGEVAETAAGVVSDAVGAVASNLIPIALAVGAFFLLSSSNGNKDGYQPN